MQVSGGHCDPLSAVRSGSVQVDPPNSLPTTTGLSVTNRDAGCGHGVTGEESTEPGAVPPAAHWGDHVTDETTPPTRPLRRRASGASYEPSPIGPAVVAPLNRASRIAPSGTGASPLRGAVKDEGQERRCARLPLLVDERLTRSATTARSADRPVRRAGTMRRAAGRSRVVARPGSRPAVSPTCCVHSRCELRVLPEPGRVLPDRGVSSRG